MMAVEIDKERLYRGMTAEQIAAHEDWVRRIKAERAAEEQRLIDEELARRVELAGMTDLQVVEAMFSASVRQVWDSLETDPEKALQILLAAGFVRQTDRANLVKAHECIRDAVKVIVEMSPKLCDPPLPGALAQLNELLVGAAKALTPIETLRAR